MNDDSQPSGKAPTFVTLYSWGTGSPVRVAEFRLTQSGTVELAIVEPTEATVARNYFDHGVDVDDDRRTVLPNEEPEMFMRGLLTPRRSSYYSFADESGADNPE
ncbi:hypothetical protein ACFFQW_40810 [Umezawaea endophytica]|uniref:Uncharacterized protein n=1 Tax=Umezawaea endophytica TaxID=1654476 RepID=A0A9X2VV26_9PSEU|nr:hypothetical protein [Umezawaea endophytica]MCS7482877.1 hypothetical protein [Umezawaea endophytica]